MKYIIQTSDQIIIHNLIAIYSIFNLIKSLCYVQIIIIQPSCSASITYNSTQNSLIGIRLKWVSLTFKELVLELYPVKTERVQRCL